eukprot:9297141-Lingulodinium_polyedra.AAC.1
MSSLINARPSKCFWSAQPRMKLMPRSPCAPGRSRTRRCRPTSKRRRPAGGRRHGGATAFG